MDLLKLYIEEQNLTIEDGKVWVKPSSQDTFTTYPIPEDRQGCLLIEKDEYFALLLYKLMFNETLDGLVNYNISEPEESL